MLVVAVSGPLPFCHSVVPPPGRSRPDEVVPLCPNGYNCRMRKWLRSWFAWRFSLIRLVIAVVFLGAFVGLNTRRIGPAVYQMQLSSPPPALIVRHFRGWPFPFSGSTEAVSRRQAEMDSVVLDRAPADFLNGKRDGFFEPAWTHRTYFLISPFRNVPESGPIALDLEGYIALGTIDALFALVVLTLILFLRPRRKPPDETP